MKIRLAIAALGCAMTVSLSGLAQQQPWLQDRRYSEGAGVRVGDLELHPGIAAQAGYDSNFLQRSESERPLAFWRFRVIPHLMLSTLSAQRRASQGGTDLPTVAFRAGISAVGNALLPAQQGAESDTAARSQRTVAADARFNLDILPGRPWGGDLHGSVGRVTDPSNSPEASSAWNRDVVVLGAGLLWRPRGGVFDWRLGYEFRWNHFEQQSFQSLDNTHHYLQSSNRWRFLPRTAIIQQTEVGTISYSGTNAPLAGSQLVRARAGLSGLVTNHFGVLAMAGWGATFYAQDKGPARDFDSFIGAAKLTWYVSAQPTLPEDGVPVGLSTISVGYTRTFSNNYLSSYYQLDRMSASASYLLVQRVLLTADAGLGYYTFPPVFWPHTGQARFPVPSDSWNQTRLDLTGFAEYRLAETLGVNLTVRYNSNLTSNKIPLNSPGSAVPVGGAQVDDLSFSRVEAYFGIRWFL